MEGEKRRISPKKAVRVCLRDVSGNTVNTYRLTIITVLTYLVTAAVIALVFLYLGLLPLPIPTPRAHKPNTTYRTKSGMIFKFPN